MQNLTTDLKIFYFEDRENHLIVAKNKEEAINWYVNNWADEDILNNNEYTVIELPKDTKVEINIMEDEDLMNIINKYKNQKEKVEYINIWLYLYYWIIEQTLKGNEFETPNLIASSVY